MSRWITSIILAAVLVSTAITSVPARAQSGITLVDSSAQIGFPSALAFNIKAESRNDIVKVRLHYQVERMNFAQVTEEAWPVFTPSTKIQTQWVWDMRKSNLPVGTTVEYWWTIQDSTGDILTTPLQKARFDDISHNWKKMTSGQITLLWYSGDQSFADQLMASCQQALEKLFQDTGVHLEQPVSIYTYASSEDLRNAMVFPQEWLGGATYAEFGIIAITVSSNELATGKKNVAHELGHMVTHQITYSPYGAIIPFWLDEGLATYVEGKLDLYLQYVLQQAINQHRLISVRSLASPFSAIPQEAYLSYAESESIVEFLIDKYGGDKIISLLKLFKEGNTYDDALMQIYGFDQDGLDTLWQQYLFGPATSQIKTKFSMQGIPIPQNYLWNRLNTKILSVNSLSEVY
jgi:Peptidase MA superfamily